MKKILLLIDGDHISASSAKNIVVRAKDFGEIYEAHCFTDFANGDKNWDIAYLKYGMQLHHIPRIGQKNVTDNELMGFAVDKLCKCPEIDAVIVVANDKDYIPLAKYTRENAHKKAIMFYTAKKDRAVDAYDSAVLIENPGKSKSSQNANGENLSEAENELKDGLLNLLKTRFENGANEVMLADLRELNPKKGFRKKISKLFRLCPELNKVYTLITDGEARIIKK